MSGRMRLASRAFELYKLLDLGDHIGVTGICFARGPAS